MTAWDSLVNSSGLMRGAPLGRAEGVAQSWERHLDDAAYRNPAVPGNAVPLFARSVTRQASGEAIVDPTLETASALELALESHWLHPTFEALSDESAA